MNVNNATDFPPSKRKRARKDSTLDSDKTEESPEKLMFEHALNFHDTTAITTEQESLIVSALFELGLMKYSSPKVLIPFMPPNTSLTSEHIKSHLQKYRVHKQRSSEEFDKFYEEFIQQSYYRWINLKQIENNLEVNNTTRNTTVNDTADTSDGNTDNIEQQQAQLESLRQTLKEVNDLVKEGKEALLQNLLLCQSFNTFLKNALIDVDGTDQNSISHKV